MTEHELETGKVFDVIIVGAGPAGCVLASRLSEDPGRQILLIEAGPDLAKPGSEDQELVSPYAPLGKSNPALRFPGSTARLHAGSPPAMPYVQGFGVGGGSSINGMGVDRGIPEDYDDWRRFGISHWAWDDVLPYFRKLEHDCDYSGPNSKELHGDSGPIPVRRAPRVDWAPFSSALCDAAERRGYPFLEDYTGDFREGFSAVPTNQANGRRMSAAMAYLNAEVRGRKNLAILSSSLVERVNVANGRADGVDVRINGARRRLSGREIVLACGAIRSPSLLMQSGIGPGDHLRQNGIGVSAQLKGVGANLQNHPFVALVTYLPKIAFQKTDDPIFLQNWMRYSSNQPECQINDMHLIMVNKSDWHAIGRRVGTLVVSIFKPYSKGSVMLSGPDPASAPNVDFNLLSDERDFERLVEGLRFGTELMLDPTVMKMHREVFMPDGRVIARLGRQSAKNRIAARVLATILDQPVLRKIALAKSRIDLTDLFEGEEARRKFVRKYVQVQYHVAGTCRMGKADDPDAVVDSDGKVHGVRSLRVSDASIFPAIPRGCTHVIVMMTAEKIADAIKGDWQS